MNDEFTAGGVLLDPAGVAEVRTNDNSTAESAESAEDGGGRRLLIQPTPGFRFVAGLSATLSGWIPSHDFLMLRGEFHLLFRDVSY